MEKPVVVEKVVEKPVIVEKVVESPLRRKLRQPAAKLPFPQTGCSSRFEVHR